MRCLFLLFALGAFASLLPHDQIISTVNRNPQAKWRAGYSARTAHLTREEVMHMLGNHKDISNGLPVDTEAANIAVPDEYDARKEHPECGFHVLDQAQCGSCWAFACAESFADRLCIATNGSTNVDLSPQVLVSCDWEGNQGCNGGIPRLAWDYLEFAGLPSLTCVPYTSGSGEKGTCPKKCSDSESFVTHKVKLLSTKAYKGVSAIQGAIFANGPIETGFTVYEDFMDYQSGVYHHVTGSMLGGHAVKIVGWGTEAGTPYWIVQNSWGPHWGENGYFRILRGKDECGFEADGVAGLPSL